MHNFNVRVPERGSLGTRLRLGGGGGGGGGSGHETEAEEVVASFPGLQSPNAVEGLVKLLRRMTSGRR